jgi:extracellular elastinolytic metalloproteinase
MVKLTSLSCLIGFVTLAANAAPSTHIAPSGSSSDKQLNAGRKIVDVTPRHYNSNVKSHTFVTYVDNKSIATRGLKPADAAVKLATNLISAAKGQQSHRFEVRDDSYFDESHGLHHIYVKQSIHGLQIHNGGLHAVVSENGESLIRA